MSKFWYSEMNANTSGATVKITITTGALDAMFLLGALSELFEADNWEIDPDVDLGSDTVEDAKAGIAEYWQDLVTEAFNAWEEL